MVIIGTGGVGAGVLAAIAAGIKITGAAVVGRLVVTYISKQMLPQDLYLPLYAISPGEIFANQIAMLDVNFFNPNKYDAINTVAGTGKEQVSAAAQLQATISQWYFTIRNFAIVALLSILVYVGIRIVISSSAQDKAKYKQRLLDWLVAMCLLFFLHYIMTFAVTITELITKSLNGINKQTAVIIGNDDSLKDYHWDFTQRQDKLDDDGNPTGEQETITIDSYVFKDEKDGMYQQLKDMGVIQSGSVGEDGTTTSDGEMLVWPTNLMGKARIEAQLLVEGEDEEGDNTLVRQFGYTLLFVGFVIYTVLFLFRYLKRLLMLAFLTIIAPFVAMTYPLDKMNDGSAQAFNMWLKEYVYNLLIQPVHLILYTVLIGSAIEFATDNLLYSLAAFGFILQAEKIMRKFFGFEKASTLAGGSALGGAMAMQGINMLRKLGGPKKGNQKGGGKAGNGAIEDGKNKVRYADRKADKGKGVDDLLDKSGNDDDSSGALPLPSTGNPLDKTSDEGNSIKDAKGLYNAGFIDADSWNETKESDTRGMGQWIYDSYQGSGLQSGLHNAAHTVGDKIANSKPGQWTRKVGSGISHGARSVYDLAGRGVRAVPKPIRNTIRGATSVVGKGLETAGRAAIHAAPRIGRMAAKGTVAGAAAITGMAAGLVSDDFGNVGKWGAAGAGAGWIAGGGIASTAEDMTHKASGAIDQGAETIASTYTIAAHGRDAEEERLKKQADVEAMRDRNRRKLYADKLDLSAKEAKEAMKKAQKYREAGITDDELIIKAMKSKTFTSDIDSDERIIAASLASEVGKDQKKLEYVKKELGKKSGVSQDDINKYEKGIKEINKWTV